MDAKKLDETALTTFRLCPDMLPMARQIMIATDTVKGLAARLAGVESPVYEDMEIVTKRGDKKTRFRGMQFLLGHALPNVYFHVTTAYNILRHNGVEIGKRDYLGNP